MRDWIKPTILALEWRKEPVAISSLHVLLLINGSAPILAGGIAHGTIDWKGEDTIVQKATCATGEATPCQTSSTTQKVVTEDPSRCSDSLITIDAIPLPSYP